MHLSTTRQSNAGIWEWSSQDVGLFLIQIRSGGYPQMVWYMNSIELGFRKYRRKVVC